MKMKRSQRPIEDITSSNVRETYTRMLREVGNIPKILSGGTMFNSRKEAVDAYQSLYEQRMALEAEVDLVKAEEDTVKQWLVADMQKHNIRSPVEGKEWVVELFRGVNGTLADFNLFSMFIARNRAKGAFSLLYRRINQDRVREWSGMKLADSGRVIVSNPIPGIGSEVFVKLHHRKR